MARVHRVIVQVVLVGLLLMVGVQALNPCQLTDYSLVWTGCTGAGATRSQVPIMMNQCDNTITGGAVEPPTGFYSLPCLCAGGQQRLPDGTCSPCSGGSYSPDGIVFDSNDFQYLTNTTSLNNLGPVAPIPNKPGVTLECSGRGCSPWIVGGDNNSYISSGVNPNNINTSFIINAIFFGTQDTNSIDFQFQVDAESCLSDYYNCDGLTFYVDDQQALPDPRDANNVKSLTHDWMTISYPGLGKSKTCPWGTHLPLDVLERFFDILRSRPRVPTEYCPAQRGHGLQ